MPNQRKHRRDDFARYTDSIFCWLVSEIVRRRASDQVLYFDRILGVGMAYAAYLILRKPLPIALDSDARSFFEKELLPRFRRSAPRRTFVRWMIYDVFVADGIPGRPMNPSYQAVADGLQIDVAGLNAAYAQRLKQCRRKPWSRRF